MFEYHQIVIDFFNQVFECDLLFVTVMFNI